MPYNANNQFGYDPGPIVLGEHIDVRCEPINWSSELDESVGAWESGKVQTPVRLPENWASIPSARETQTCADILLVSIKSKSEIMTRLLQTRDYLEWCSQTKYVIFYVNTSYTDFVGAWTSLILNGRSDVQVVTLVSRNWEPRDQSANQWKGAWREGPMEDADGESHWLGGHELKLKPIERQRLRNRIWMVDALFASSPLAMTARWIHGYTEQPVGDPPKGGGFAITFGRPAGNKPDGNINPWFVRIYLGQYLCHPVHGDNPSSNLHDAENNRYFPVSFRGTPHPGMATLANFKATTDGSQGGFRSGTSVVPAYLPVPFGVFLERPWHWFRDANTHAGAHSDTAV